MSDIPQSDLGQNQVPPPPPPHLPVPHPLPPPPPQNVAVTKVVEYEEEQPDTPGGALANMGCQCLVWALLLACLCAVSGVFPCSFGQAFIIAFCSLLALGLYFLPTVFAFSFKHPFRWPILAVNLFFGCTAIGWVVAFIWCFVGRPKPKK